MKRIALILIILISLPATSPAQHCLGLTTGARQLSAGALYSRTEGVTSYGAIADVNFAGPLSAGLRYTYSGDVPSTDERNVHIIHSRLAYELSTGKLSLCPSVGLGYEDGAASLRNPLDEGQMLHPGWRRLTVPFMLNAGVEMQGPGELIVVPSVAAGGIWQRFTGRNGAVPRWDLENPTSSTTAWAGSASVTLGWQRFWVTGMATDNTFPASRLEWVFSAGWVIPWDLFVYGREPT